MIDLARFNQVRKEWTAVTQPPPPDAERFSNLKHEADGLIAAGLWASGPNDLLSVVGRSRDELMHSRLIGWLLLPTNRHGLGRLFLTKFADSLWPGEGLFQTGQVLVETEEAGAAVDDLGQLREARADIVIRGEGATVVIENKLDAGEQPQQCERLYWGWSAEAGDARYVFLTPTGRQPTTAVSAAAKAAWRTMSYADLRGVLAGALESSRAPGSIGGSTATQYLNTLTSSVVPA